MNLTPDQKAALLDLIQCGQPDVAIERCIEWCQDSLAASLLERGGYGTLQLNPPGVVPRLHFVELDQVQSVTMAKINGVLIHRDGLHG
ncbi:hypothetical protein HA052_04150 [Chromobacterium haemolyticum]|uniref:AbiTii domain-containing protein n=1 Tax=Chromobacterium fluminis TaxID=3044269 RepID=A0ABX0LAI3_9NEIS|nr:hypothetical protein [Chromobacterium haemolyticum]NHR04382.1 hypothetical protein [Chromobacterium haemolyticum]